MNESETWIDVYDDGSAAEGPVTRQYYLSFWWAVTTLFAVNPISPITDPERSFMIIVNIVNRLLLAYIIGPCATCHHILTNPPTLHATRVTHIVLLIYLPPPVFHPRARLQARLAR